MMVRLPALALSLEGVKAEDVPGGGGIGSISFVSCAAGDEGKAQLDSLEEEVEQGEF